MQRRTLVLIVAGIMAAGLLATALGVYAQPPGGGAPGGPGPGGGPGGGQFRGMMGGMMSQGVAIAVSGESVFVVYMGTLFKFNVDTLEEEAQVRLRPQGMGPGGPGGAPGFGAPPAPAAPPGGGPAMPPPAGQE